MKTSNKLLIAGILFLLVSLVAYDLKVKEAYNSGSYKNAYRDFTSLNFKDFDSVDVISSTAANVKFIQGPFKVIIDDDALEFVKIKQQGKRLQITARFEYDYHNTRSSYVLVISCPRLVQLNTSAEYTANGKQVIDTAVKEEWRMRRVLIDGFKEDSLSIHQDYASTVVLANNTIKSTFAVTGASPGSGSKLIVLKNNKFGNANIDILNKSSFLLNNAAIQNLSYHLADSARMTVNGAAQNLFSKYQNLK